MQVRYGFAGIGAVVEHQAVTTLFQTQFLRDFGGFEHQVAEHFVVVGDCFCNSRNGLLRNNQDVCGGLRLDVAKRDDEVVFVNDLRRYFARDDFFEQGFAHVNRLTYPRMDANQQ